METENDTPEKKGNYLLFLLLIFGIMTILSLIFSKLNP